MKTRKHHNNEDTNVGPRPLQPPPTPDGRTRRILMVIWAIIGLIAWTIAVFVALVHLVRIDGNSI